MYVDYVRYGAVYRQAQAANSGPSVQTKLDSARDEVEDSVTKVDQTRVTVSLYVCQPPRSTLWM